MERLKQHIAVAASLAELQAEKDQEKADKAARKKEEKQAQENKKKEAEKAEEERVESLLPSLKEDAEKGLEHVIKLKKPRLYDLLNYHFKDTTKGLKQKRLKNWLT